MRRAGALALAAVGVLSACTGGDDDGAAPTSTRPETVILETTTSTTSAPLVGQPVAVVEQGVSTFSDPFDPSTDLGGYGVVLHNPNPDLVATGVHVTTRLLDAAGVEVLVDTQLLNGIMPDQRMAVGRLLIEPLDPAPTQLQVAVEVAAWLRPADGAGALTAEEVVTEDQPDGVAVTRFRVRSTWTTPEEGVDVTALYRAEDGRILAAETTTLAMVAPETTTEGQIQLLTPIPMLATTEVLVGRGFAAQTTG